MSAEVPPMREWQMLRASTFIPPPDSRSEGLWRAAAALKRQKIEA